MKKELSVEAIRDYFERTFGYFPKHWKLLSENRPEAMTLYYDLREIVMRDGALSRQTKELMAMTICATQRHAWGTEHHGRSSVRAGASLEQIFEACLVVWLAAGAPSFIEGLKGYEAAVEETKRLGARGIHAT